MPDPVNRREKYILTSNKRKVKKEKKQRKRKKKVIELIYKVTAKYS